MQSQQEQQQQEQAQESQLQDQAQQSYDPQEQEYINKLLQQKDLPDFQQTNLSQRSKLNKIDLQKDKTHSFFKDSRVNSCSFVKQKGNQILAVPYYKKPNQSYADQMEKSTYTTSITQQTYKVRQNLHIGMSKKPLEAYDPNSYRNRLPIADPKMPATNSSQIEFGDRNLPPNKQFLSISRVTYGNFGKQGQVTNTGILAEKTKWHHHLQQK